MSQDEVKRPSVATVIEALNDYQPGMSGVIKEMASMRGIDPDTMDIDTWKALIIEEADFSLQATGNNFHERERAKRHTHVLKTIAKFI
jgi:hypothetical protein